MSIVKASKAHSAFLAAKNLNPKALTFQEAQQVFVLLAKRPDIAFDYSFDGCEATAHMMCMAAKELGLSPYKAWAFESDDSSLIVNRPDGTQWKWGYHIALALQVKMPDDQFVPRVFDPGLFDGPVSVAKWGAIMKASSNRLYVKRFGVAPHRYSFDYSPTMKTVDAIRQKKPERTMASVLESQPRLTSPLNP